MNPESLNGLIINGPNHFQTLKLVEDTVFAFCLNSPFSKDVSFSIEV